MYGEYGLGRRFAAVLNYAGYRRNAFKTTDPVSGSGDAFVGLQYGIFIGKFPLSILVGPEIPIGNADLKAQNNNSPFGNVINLPTGDGNRMCGARWRYHTLSPSGTQEYLQRTSFIYRSLL